MHHPTRPLIPLLLLSALAGCGGGGGGPGASGTYTITATATATPATAAPVSGGSVLGTGPYVEGARVTLTALPAPGFAFVGWEENGITLATTTRYSFTATTDRRLTARFRVTHPFVDRMTESDDTLTVSVADFDGDGFPDLLTDRVWLNNGRGGFRAPFNQRFSNRTLAANFPADFDGDGDPDIVQTSGPGQYLLKFWRNDGRGQFTMVADAFGTPAPNAVGILAAGDLDGDGDPDVMVAADPSLTANVWLNDGSGSFAPGQDFADYGNALSLRTQVSLADLDGDGDLDRLFVDNDLDVRFNDGSGSFSSPQRFFLPYASYATTGDLDGDGDLDLAVGSDNVRLFSNDGRGTFTPLTTLAGSTRGDGGLAFGDFDDDGRLDLVVGSSSMFFPNRVWLGDGQGGFTAGPALEANCTRTVAVADLDGDGNPDIATANGDCGNAQTTPNRVWLGDGRGNFREPETRLAGAGGDALAFATADLDGDGDTDLVDDTGQVWLGDGRGGFTAGTPIVGLVDGTTTLYDLVLLDLDADDAPDLIAARSDSTRIWWGNGDGTFTDSGLILPGSATHFHSLALGDFDGDGDTDWAIDVEVNGEQYVYVWSNSGDRNFPRPVSYTPVTHGYPSIRVTDLNGDGTPDLLAYYWSRVRDIQPLLNAGNGSFTVVLPLDLTGLIDFPRDIAAADLNGDGNADLVFALPLGATNLPVWLGDGQGGFTEGGGIPGNDPADTLALGDIDGDGDTDLVAVNRNGAASEIWLNDGDAGFSDGGRIRHADASGITFRLARLTDLDGNGAPELIVAGTVGARGGFSGIRIYRNAIAP